MFCSRTLTTAFFLTLFVPLVSHGADILWWTGELEEEKDVSNFGTVVEAFAFTGERGNNALDGTYPLEDPFDVNGTSFTPLNLTLGDEPEFLGGWTYDNGEFGHTEAEEGLDALLSGLAFESGTNPQFLELDNLTVGQGYQVEFYYYHRAVGRSVEFDDGGGNAILVPNRSYGSGYFVADSSSQEIIASANTGSQFLNGYQLREVAEQPPIPHGPEPPEPSVPALIGYWNFDGNPQDQSGKGNHGVISGGVEYDSDVPAVLGAGKSASFDGFADSHVEITHNEMMPATSHSDFTISMWVKGDGASGDNNDDRIFSEGLSTNANPLFNLGTKNDGANGTLDFFYRNGSSTGHQFSLDEPFDDEWHHVLWRDEERVGTLYVDGEEDTTFDHSQHPTFEADITSIGSVLRASDCCNFTGNIDDVSIFSFSLSDEDIATLASGGSPLNISIPGALVGDYNGNGQLDAGDLDLNAAVGIASGDLAYDLNQDGLVNTADRKIWVNDLKNTWMGDSDLNGVFDSGDLVTVFASAKYETGQTANWGQGDWNGDQTFDSGDLVEAFSNAGYEAGQRPGGPNPATVAVPEPSSILLTLISFLGWSGLIRRRHQ